MYIHSIYIYHIYIHIVYIYHIYIHSIYVYHIYINIIYISYIYIYMIYIISYISYIYILYCTYISCTYNNIDYYNIEWCIFTHVCLRCEALKKGQRGNTTPFWHFCKNYFGRVGISPFSSCKNRWCWQHCHLDWLHAPNSRTSRHQDPQELLHISCNFSCY